MLEPGTAAFRALFSDVTMIRSTELDCRPAGVDTGNMDSVSSIAAYSTALSQARVQSAAATKVAKLAQGSQQMVADLLTQALGDVQESMRTSNAEAGRHFDSFA